MKPYTYVLVRDDIPPVQKAVQIAHAALHAGFEFRKPEEISSIVLCTVPDEAALQEAAARLARHGVDYEMFYEPDFGPMGHSALASRPITRKKERFLFKDYPKLEMA